MITVGNYTLPFFEGYLILANLLAFTVHGICAGIKKKKGAMPAVPFLIFLSLAGGAAGSLTAALIWDRKAEKENMMLRVTSVCFLFLTAIVYLIYRGFVTDVHHFSFWELFIQHKFLLYYLGGISLLTFIFFGVDKLKAKKEKERIKITTLLLLSAAGGSPGGLLGMLVFRHKIRKSYFSAGIPMILVTQIAVIIYLMNSTWFSGIVH